MNWTYLFTEGIKLLTDAISGLQLRLALQVWIVSNDATVSQGLVFKNRFRLPQLKIDRERRAIDRPLN